MDMTSGTGGFMNLAMVLPRQPDEVIGEPLHGLTRLRGELVGWGIVDRPSRDGDLVNAPQEGTSLSHERLSFLERSCRGGVGALVGERVVGHCDSFARRAAVMGISDADPKEARRRQLSRRAACAEAPGGALARDVQDGVRVLGLGAEDVARRSSGQHHQLDPPAFRLRHDVFCYRERTMNPGPDHQPIAFPRNPFTDRERGVAVFPTQALRWPLLSLPDGALVNDDVV